MLRSIRILMMMALVFSAQSAFADAGDWSKSKAEHKKAAVDQTERQTLDRLFASDAHAKTLYDMSFGYATFEGLKFTFGISAGGGRGVAVTKASNQRYYMKMGTGGVGFGLGGQKSRTVFLFEDQSTFEQFVYKGWQGDAAVNAVAGTKGENLKTSFTQGMVVYQVTESGLMLKADVSGTKYWLDKKLNRLSAPQTVASRSDSVYSEAIEPTE